MLKARKHAEDYYTTITTDFPNYPQLDEVLYYLAYEYEQGNDNDNARKTYFTLIQSRPNSKYIPNAYLAFGELFFNEAQGDPSKWGVAQQAYQKVIGFPPPDNKVYGYAWYKLAYVFWNSGDFAAALSAFKKTIDYGTTFTQLPGASKLADSARRDIIPVYALKGDPSAAYNFFHNLSGDHGGENAKTFKMMDDLGNNYLDTGHYPEAIALYRDLLVRDRAGDKTCIYQAHITEATMAMKSGNKDGIKSELDRQVVVYNDFKNGNHPPDAKQECANKTAALLTETAMAWHLEAVGSNGQRGTGDRRTMDKAAAVYKKVVDTWSQADFANFTFPRIVKEDWPNIYKSSIRWPTSCTSRRTGSPRPRRSTLLSTRTRTLPRLRSPPTRQCFAGRKCTTAATRVTPQRRARVTCLAPRRGRLRLRKTSSSQRSSPLTRRV